MGRSWASFLWPFPEASVGHRRPDRVRSFGAVIILLFVLQRTGTIQEIGFLWYNLIAPVIVITVSLLLQPFTRGPGNASTEMV
jgi:hypothetical protein